MERESNQIITPYDTPYFRMHKTGGDMGEKFTERSAVFIIRHKEKKSMNLLILLFDIFEVTSMMDNWFIVLVRCDMFCFYISFQYLWSFWTMLCFFVFQPNVILSWQFCFFDDKMRKRVIFISFVPWRRIAYCFIALCEWKTMIKPNYSYEIVHDRCTIEVTQNRW